MAAEIILTPIAELIIQHLGSAAVKEIGLLWGVSDEFEELTKTLSTIEAVLRDAEKRQLEEEQVKEWLQRLEGVVSEADDLLDEVATEGLQRQVMHGKKLVKEVRTFFSSSNRLVFRHKMAHRVQKIQRKLAKVAADRESFHFVESRGEIKLARKVRDDSHSFVVEGNVVGRDRDRKALVELLLDPENRTQQETVSVIPIFGMGGLGKTTLAQLVFNDERVQQHFDLKIWVCVSNDFDVKALCEKIIQTITDKTLEKPDMEKVQRELRKAIEGRRYLLVLDDVWNEDPQKWKNLKDLLTNCAEGSRIIVTTRSKKVARITAGAMRPYHLGTLDPEDSWCLFNKIAFNPESQLTNSTINEDVAKEIVKRCGGVPLAISMIGSMLYFRGPDLDWRSFLEKEFSNIPQEENSILETLRLSYDDLPLHLKPCFAYCRLFPKDFEIDVQTLILLWIAQGFIKSSNGSQNLEDIGYEYFMDLFWRSFFQEAEREEANRITKCKMHDLVHDLAMSVAGEKYEMLASGEENIQTNKVRHVSFGFFLSDYKASSLLQAKRLRSLLNIKQYSFLGQRACDQILSNLKFLRMLDLHDTGVRKVPSIGKLKHLRYLDLSENEIKTLPTSITKLVNLQTLKLNGCESLSELPSDIEKLVNLRHLELEGCDRITHMPRGLSKLTKLQTLSLVVLNENNPKGSIPDELMSLDNLRGKLTIRGIRRGMETTVTKLSENEHLRSLGLAFKCGDDDASSSGQEWKTTLEGLQPHPNLRVLSLEWYGGSSLSSLLPTLTNLVKLRLEHCKKCQQLPSLDQFHSLKEMELRDLPSLEYITINEGDNYFSTSSSQSVSVLPSLQKLRLYKLPKFRGWWRLGMAENQVEQLILPSFPHLSSFSITHCEKLTSMPRYPNIEGWLTLSSTSWKTFEQTSMAEEATSTSTSPTTATIPRVSVSSYPLSKLTYLKLDDVTDLEYFPDVGMKGLASLKKLRIWRCHRLKNLSPCIQYLTSLEELNIKSCEEFEGIKWPETPALTSLRRLELGSLPKLKHIVSPAIQYLTSLQELTIDSCEELQVSNEDSIAWQTLTSLRKLELWSLSKLKHLSFQGIQYLTSLEELDINWCEEFEGIKWPETPVLTSLRKLELRSLPKLKHLVSPAIQYLTSLQQLSIWKCEELQVSNDDSIAWQSLTSLRKLELTSLSKLKHLSVQGIQSLTSLEELKIESCKEFEGIKWPETPALTSLRKLELRSLPKLKHLVSPGIQYLTSLQQLTIRNCKELQVSNDDSIAWQSLTSLHSLEFKGLPQLVTLPGGLQFLTTLKRLEIWYCNNLTALPDWICKLSSLQSLTIWDCPNFKSVPGSISSLTSLQHLEINDKEMNPREINKDLDMSSASGPWSWKISKKFKVLRLCNK